MPVCLGIPFGSVGHVTHGDGHGLAWRVARYLGGGA